MDLLAEEKWLEPAKLGQGCKVRLRAKGTAMATVFTSNPSGAGMRNDHESVYEIIPECDLKLDCEPGEQ